MGKNIDKVIDSFFGGEMFLEALGEVADECMRKMSVHEIRKLYRYAGRDGCNLMEANYNKGIIESYN